MPCAAAASTSAPGVEAPYRSEYPEATCRCGNDTAVRPRGSVAGGEGAGQDLLVRQTEGRLDQVMERLGVAQQVVGLASGDRVPPAGLHRGAPRGSGGEEGCPLPHLGRDPG